LDKLEPFVQGEEISSLSIYNRIMRAFIDDAEEKITHCADAEVKDACLLASVQLINHYKICAYGTAAAFANALNEKDQASVFHGAEINEKQIDDRLSQLAEHEINTRAKTPIVLTM
jgi:ferritin-like metal-binding protein YciE